MWFASQVLLSVAYSFLIRPFKCFSLKCESDVYTHSYWQYIISGSLVRIINLGITDEVFELSQKIVLLSLDFSIETM